MLAPLYGWKNEGQKGAQGNKQQCGDPKPRLSGSGALLENARLTANVARDPHSGGGGGSGGGPWPLLTRGSGHRRPRSDVWSSESSWVVRGTGVPDVALDGVREALLPGRWHKKQSTQSGDQPACRPRPWTHLLVRRGRGGGTRGRSVRKTPVKTKAH